MLSLATPFAIFDCIIPLFSVSQVIETFHHLFLIASLILPSETLLTYCPYISTIVVYLFVVYSCPLLTEGNRGKSYLFGSIHDGRA
jgi:hypothetical protein